MKIAVVHNFYQQPGGEDEVFAAETALLESHGHEVIRYTADNRTVDAIPRWRLAAGTVWNWREYRVLRRLLAEQRPEILHLHNTMPLVSPSVYYAARAEGVPVVQSLHNSRLMCPSANFYRDGRLCTDCLGRTFGWPGVVHRCYHGSAAQSAVIATMASAHRVAGTWHSAVHRYIVASAFYRALFERGGLPSDRISVKPHFVERDPGVIEPDEGYALFIGRLDPEKGVPTLLQAWQRLEQRGLHIPLRIRGEGQLLPEVLGSKLRSLSVVPRLSRTDLVSLLKRARCLIWPCAGYYETFGLVVIEAFAAGVPVICSDIGVAPEMVAHGLTGFRYRAGDPEALAQAVDRFFQLSPNQHHALRRAARLEYETKYTAARNHELLLEIYRRAIGEAPCASSRRLLVTSTRPNP